MILAEYDQSPVTEIAGSASISVAVTGGEEDHLAIRRAVVEYMSNPARDPPLRQHHLRATTAEYLTQSSMASSGTWATDCENPSNGGSVGDGHFRVQSLGQQNSLAMLPRLQKSIPSGLAGPLRIYIKHFVQSLWIRHRSVNNSYYRNVQ